MNLHAVNLYEYWFFKVFTIKLFLYFSKIKLLKILKKRTENVSMNMHIEYEDIILLKYQNLKAFLRRERNFVFLYFNIDIIKIGRLCIL